MTDDGVGMPTVTQQDGHLPIGQSGFVQGTDLFAKFVQHPGFPVVFFVFFVEEADLHVSVVSFVRTALLGHVAVSLRHSDGSVRREPVQFFGGSREQGVVERDDAAFAPVVDGKVPYVGAVYGHFLLYVFQDGPVSVPPTVDALFHVAHNQVAEAGGHALQQQDFKVLPLHGGSVLELVYHHMMEKRAHFFENERSIVFFYQFVEQDGGLGQQETVVLVVQGRDLLVDDA